MEPITEVKIIIGFSLLMAFMRWRMAKERERRVRDAYKFNPPTHGAAEWSTVDDVRKGGLLL
jgi:hypothetical protein